MHGGSLCDIKLRRSTLKVAIRSPHPEAPGGTRPFAFVPISHLPYSGPAEGEPALPCHRLPAQKIRIGRDKERRWPRTHGMDDCHFAFNFEIRRVGCRKATFFALKGEMPIRFVRCSLIPACERGAVSGARYDRRWRANGLPCDRSEARRPWRTLSGPVPSPSQPAARPCKRCLIFRGKNLDFIGKISHLAAKDCP